MRRVIEIDAHLHHEDDASGMIALDQWLARGFDRSMTIN